MSDPFSAIRNRDESGLPVDHTNTIFTTVDGTESQTNPYAAAMKRVRPADLKKPDGGVQIVSDNDDEGSGGKDGDYEEDDEDDDDNDSGGGGSGNGNNGLLTAKTALSQRRCCGWLCGRSASGDQPDLEKSRPANHGDPSAKASVSPLHNWICALSVWFPIGIASLLFMWEYNKKLLPLYRVTLGSGSIFNLVTGGSQYIYLAYMIVSTLAALADKHGGLPGVNARLNSRAILFINFSRLLHLIACLPSVALLITYQRAQILVPVVIWICVVLITPVLRRKTIDPRLYTLLYVVSNNLLAAATYFIYEYGMASIETKPVVGE